MMKRCSNLLGLLLLFLMGSSLSAVAQSSGDGYNPDNPQEPNDPAVLLHYTVTVKANLTDACTLSGGGTYKSGTNITVKATTKSGYKFLYWLKDEETEPYSTSTSFSYKVGTANVCFTAVYEKAKKVTVALSDSKAGTVSGGGSGLYKAATTTIKTTANANYEFRYWQKNSDATPYTTDMQFTYTVEDDDVTFTAVYEYVEPPYIPDNPDEPLNEADKLAAWKVNVTLQDEAAGVVSGAGRYKYGNTVTVSTSPNAGYEFEHWLKGTEVYATTPSFTYTVVAEDVTFVAVYTYVGIPEPPAPVTHKLNLVASPAGSCTFSLPSGERWAQGTSVYVTANAGQDHMFKGWYEGETFLSSNASFTYTMNADSDVTLTARYEYNPGNPEEPSNDNYVEYVPLHGDVNEDGNIDVDDLTMIIGAVMNPELTADNKSKMDLSNDGNVDVDDITQIIYLIMNNE